MGIDFLWIFQLERARVASDLRRLVCCAARRGAAAGGGQYGLRELSN